MWAMHDQPTHEHKLFFCNVTKTLLDVPLQNIFVFFRLQFNETIIVLLSISAKQKHPKKRNVLSVAIIRAIYIYKVAPASRSQRRDLLSFSYSAMLSTCLPRSVEALFRSSFIIANGPTSSGPNPKTNLKPKSCPKKTKVKLGLKNVSVIAKLLPNVFDYIFVHLR